MNFSHIALNCRDIEATMQFYLQHFGFVIARTVALGEGNRIVFIRHGTMLLELFAAEGDRPDAAGDGPHVAGVRHLAFQVENVDTALNELEGVPVTLGPLDFSGFIPGWRTFWLRDPDGNIVEVSQGFRDEGE